MRKASFFFNSLLSTVSWFLFTSATSTKAVNLSILDQNFLEAAQYLAQGQILPVNIPALPLPENETVVQSTSTALLEKYDPWATPEAALEINGVATPIPPEVRDTVHLRGPIQGSSSSSTASMALSISTNGTITGVQMTEDGPISFSKLPEEPLVIEDTQISAPKFKCGSDGSGALIPPLESQASIAYLNSTATSILLAETQDSTNRYQVIVAIETDYEFYQKFNDINAAVNYIASTYNNVNNIFSTETNLEIGLGLVRLWTTNSDPYTNDNSNSNIIGILLDQLLSVWNGSTTLQSQRRNVVNYMTGKSVNGGGIAYTGCNEAFTQCFFPVLCGTYQNTATNYGYGVSGIVSPPSSNYNWFVVAHGK
jgi:hypothetical protein